MMEQDSVMADHQRNETLESQEQYTEPIASLLYQEDQGGNDIKLSIYPGQDLYIGRTEHQPRSFKIDNPMVSKRHFRIYSVIYDSHDEFQPLIYCEDLESTNGTYINDSLIGKNGREIVGYLLNHDDVIEIKPSWQFRFHQPPSARSPQSPAIEQDLRHFDDRYTVSDRCLGKGQFGTVYLAQELPPGVDLPFSTIKQLACKIIDIHQAVDSLQDDSIPASNNGQKRAAHPRPGINNVMREIKILSKLSHPNIINLKKTFCSNTHLYIFTELAPAGDLFSYIDAHGGHLTDLDSRVITRQIFLAVQYMHRQGIVHRDIKPENVLMMQKDFGSRVVLTDFGFANYIHRSTGRLLSKVGTSGFVAPEVNLIDEAAGGYTMAADLWSLGVLTICLLTGYSSIPREEFSQNSQQEIVDLFMTPHDHISRERWQNLTGRAYDFIQKIVIMSPGKRMTIDQALEHSWFTHGAEAKHLIEAYDRVTRFWRKRDNFEQVMEDLPGRISVSYPEAEEGAPGPRRRRIPDVSSSPYFGLDRHLGQKIVSKRKTILEEVNNSKARFIVSDVHKTATTRPRKEKQSIEYVDGRDIFGATSTLHKEKPEDPDPYEEAFVPTTTVPRVERPNGYDLSDPAAPTSPSKLLSIRPRDGSVPKRLRVESETAED